MDDHDGEHGCEDCVMCPAYVPPIGSRLHGQWAGSNEDPVRWCALCEAETPDPEPVPPVEGNPK